MDIKVGKYHIKSDSMCMWIEEEYCGKTKGGKEKTYTRRASGYCLNFEQLFNNFKEHKTRESTATDVKELLADLALIEEEIKEMIKSSQL